MTLAEAIPLVPALAEVTETVLVCNPAAVPVTFIAKLHDFPPVKSAFDKLMTCDPATAEMDPLPQSPTRPLGVDMDRPGGSTSKKPMPVTGKFKSRLVITKLKVVFSFSAIVAAPKVSEIVGGANTVIVDDAVAPLPL